MNLIGQTLGKYRILQEIGRGGMATVYKAYQPSLDRHVAIKVMAPFLSQDQDFVKRFRQEALAAAALDHPNIIHIYDAGQEAGYHYIAMEYVPGGNLRQRLKAGKPLDITTAVSIAIQIGAALDHAHRHGFIHRDVKPSNVLLGQEGRAVLSDLGIAKAIAATRLTRMGTAIGTPEYMSPEQIEGTEVDHRSDIYSLGIVLYEMLAGRAPFQADTPLVVLYKQQKEPPPDLAQFNPDVSEGIAAVVTKALAKDRELRFRTAREMIHALQEAATQVALPVISTLPGEPTRLLVTEDATPPTGPPTPTRRAGRLRTTLLRGGEQAGKRLQALVEPLTEVVGTTLFQRTGQAGTRVQTFVEPFRNAFGATLLRGSRQLGKLMGSLVGRLLVTALKALAALTVALGILAAILLLVFSVVFARYVETTLPQLDWDLSLLSTTGPNRFTEADFDQVVGPDLEARSLGIVRNADLDFNAPDRVEASGRVLGIPVTIRARLRVANERLQIDLEQLNGLPLPVVGNIISGGINRGMEAIWDETPMRVRRVVVTSTGLSLWVERK